MNLREQVKAELIRYEQKRKEENERKLHRTPEDWIMIEKYIRNLLIEQSSFGPSVTIGIFVKRRFIPLALSKLQFPDDYKLRARLEGGIMPEDIKRFCKQYNLKLKYRLNSEYYNYSYSRWFFKISNKYVELGTREYLIGF